MTEVEKRRLKLLQETRKSYSDRNNPPAVHPRYQSVYQSLYEGEGNKSEKAKNTFLIRFVIAVFLFAVFFTMNYYKTNIGSISSESIINQVEKDLFSEGFPLFIEGF